jgi:hypothetical protein
VRWERLFADLEAEAAALDRLALEADVADRIRAEWSALSVGDRLGAHGGRTITCHLCDGQAVTGTVSEIGSDWVLLDGGQGRGVLLPLHAVDAVDGLGPAGLPPSVRSPVALTVALRALARDRAPVALALRGGRTLTGTVNRVGADHLDLSLHPAGEPWSSRGSATVRTVSLAAVVLVRTA